MRKIEMQKTISFFINFTLANIITTSNSYKILGIEDKIDKVNKKYLFDIVGFLGQSIFR